MNKSGIALGSMIMKYLKGIRGNKMKNTEAVVYRIANSDTIVEGRNMNNSGPVFHMDDRINLLASRLGKIVEFDSFAYVSEQEGISVSLGTEARHSCSYKIVESDTTRGQFTLTRETPFKEEELMIIETAMSSIIHTCHL